MAWATLGSLLNRVGQVLADLGRSARARFTPAARPMTASPSFGRAPPANRPPLEAAPEPDEFGDQPPRRPPTRATTDGDGPEPQDQERLRRAEEQETLTPQSSNVYGFRYERATSTLFVSYRAPGTRPDRVIDSANVIHRGRLTKTQLVAGRGSFAGNTNERGPTYAYYDVPIRVFVRMKLAHSKGTFVWDELRIRGTIYGHRFRYALVAAESTVTVDGESLPYIPRRATPAGYRTRSLADPGRGKREFRTSTLPEQRFSTRTRRSAES